MTGILELHGAKIVRRDPRDSVVNSIRYSNHTTLPRGRKTVGTTKTVERTNARRTYAIIDKIMVRIKTKIT